MVCLAMCLAALGTGSELAGASPQARSGQDPRVSGSGTLRLGAGYAHDGGSRQVRALQRRLRRLGQRPGPVDGLFGPLTRAAVQRFQAGHGLVRDGVVGPRTRRALGHPRAHEIVRSGAGYGLRGGSQPVRTLRRGLRRLGQHPGAIDGRYGPLTQRAVARLQVHAGVPVDGIAGPQTRRVVARRAERAPKASKPTFSTPKPPTSATPKPPTSGTPKLPVRMTTRPAVPGPPKAAATGGDDRLPTPLFALASVLALVGLVALLPARRRPTAPRPGPGATRPRAGVGASVPELGEGGVEAVSAARVEPLPVLGYVSVPREHSEQAGDDTAEQSAAIDAACRQRGLRLLEVVRDVESEARRALDRPGLAYALDRISEKSARGLVVSRLDSISRSAPDIGLVVERLEHDDARLVAVDFGLDTASKAGQMAARTLLTVCDMERRRLSDHTRRGLAAARARGGGTGRPAVADHAELKARIARLRTGGASLQAISDLLNAEEVPTLRGGAKWRPSSVQAAAGYKRPTKTGRKSGAPRNGA